MKEHVPVAYRCTLNSQIFRVIGRSLKNLGVFPKFNQIITSSGMDAVVENAEPVSGSAGPMAKFTGVRTSGHTFDITARGLVSENTSFVAIRHYDESEAPLA